MFEYASSSASTGDRHHAIRALRVCAVMMLVLSGAVSLRAQAGPPQAGFPITRPPYEIAPDTAAQPDLLAAPAHVAAADGSVVIEREGETISATIGEAIVPGDRIRTERGRADVWFEDGSGLAVDEDSIVDLADDRLWRLERGRVLLSLPGGPPPGGRSAGDPRDLPPDRRDGFRVDTPLGSVDAHAPGDYVIRLLATNRGDYLELTVTRGEADLVADGGTMTVRAGERAWARPQEAPSYPERVNTARLDDFQAWVAGLRDSRRGRTLSTRYLPPTLQPYGSTFDRYGSWEYEASHGYVWYPVVDAGWRPYYNGFWRPLPRYGWTWIGADRWGWPTHHYGRWGYARARWFWIPERRWAPAWVSWASAVDYVSWCPLGFDNRPVFGFSLAAGRTWVGWTVMPRRSFGVRNAYVSRFAYDGRRLPRNTPFALHASSPIPPPAFRDGRAGGRWTVDRGSQRGTAWPRAGSRSGQPDGRPAVAGSRDGRAGEGGGSLAVPRDGRRDTPRNEPRERVVLPPGDMRDDGRPDRPVYHGPGGAGVIGRPDGGDYSRRGSRAAGSGDRAVPPSDDRPTPQAPRSGVTIDPGVPRAGDRTPPLFREVMPPRSPGDDAGRARRRGTDRGDAGAPRGDAGPSAGPGGGSSEPRSSGGSAGQPVRRWGDGGQGRAVERRGFPGGPSGGGGRVESGGSESGGARGEAGGPPRSDGTARRRR